MNTATESRPAFVGTTLACLAFAFFLLLSPTLHSQDAAQAKLLKDAYRKKSEEKLFAFFDNWSAEISSNENDAPNKWVAEAHKVFAAFYQPLLRGDNGFKNEDGKLYQDNPYFIVQNSLWKILVADTIPYTPEELEGYYTSLINQIYSDDSVRKSNKYSNDSIRKIQIDYLKRNIRSMYPRFENYGISYWMDKEIPSQMVDSNITFRPPVHFAGKKIVYLTEGYKQLLDNFLGDQHVKLGEKSIMRPAYSKKKSRKKKQFIEKAAKIFYGHWGGYWQYETYPVARYIVFDTAMRRAFVEFRFIYQGGHVILEKHNGEWKIMSVKYTWME
ncbi:MAG: hypothetical protein IKX51_00355 [Bacteroidales bacterium]|nr:hypothetical protein [Bacteroidales bacterium]